MLQSKLNATLISMALAFTLLISALAASYIMPTRALPPTLFSLYVLRSPYPFWGYYGGYWEIWDELAPELAKIGIDLQIIYTTDIYDIWERMWSPSVPEGGQPGGIYGWDLEMLEWWLYPQGMLGMDEIILSKNLINGPEGGRNLFPYLSEASDEFYWGMQTTFDANARKAYADAWQEELMHNPPVINIYYPHIYELRAAYLKGYNSIVKTNDVRYCYIDRPKVQAMYDDGNLSLANYDRLYNQKTIVFAASEGWWNFLPPYVDSYTEEQFQALVFQTLYRVSIDPWPADGVPVDPKTYTIIPWLASASPTDIGWETDWDGEQVYRVRIPLREGIKWSDFNSVWNVEFLDAQDIVWTYNDIVLNFDLGASATGDFAPIVKRAEYLGNYTPGHGSYDPYTVDLVLYEPYVDLELILANDWGLAIMPRHAFGGIPPAYIHPWNKKLDNARDHVPVLGPFKYLEEGAPPSYSTVELERNPLHFGYNVSIVNPTLDPDVFEGPQGQLYWGPYDIDGWIFEYVPEAATRLANIQLHDSDYGVYPTSPVEVFESFVGDPNFICYVDFYPASNPIWMNFNNANLSNRYVRLALAHAIPYPAIFTDILQSWGIVDPVPGGSFIHPWQYYQGTQLFNTEMPLYTYDLTKAQQYLDMVIYAQTGTDYTKGCVGDANFDGIVDLDDRWYWSEEFGNAPYTRTLDNALDQTWLDPAWYSSYPWPISGDISTGSAAPGNDVDADFDNNGITAGADYGLWLAAVGNEYPFPGAW